MVVVESGERALAQQFASFRVAAERLEHAYADLRERAERVDVELASANAALERTVAERDEILRMLPLAVFRRTEAGRRAVNAAGERLDPIVLSTIDDRLAVDESGPLEIRVEDADGHTLTLSYRRVDLASEDGAALEFIEDRSQLEALRTEVARLDRLSGLASLSLGIAHELRNPLTGLVGFASLLRRSPTSADAALWTRKIEEGARRMDRIIRDLLAFAKPDRPSQRVEKTLAEWLQQVGSDLEGLRVDARDIDLEMRLCAAPTAFGQVLGNLLRNAREAGARCVTLRVESLAGVVRLAVADDGRGIAEDIVAHVFDPFVGTKDTGTGLGLAFCARAMEAMGGRIRLAVSDTGT